MDGLPQQLHNHVWYPTESGPPATSAVSPAGDGGIQLVPRPKRGHHLLRTKLLLPVSTLPLLAIKVLPLPPAPAVPPAALHAACRAGTPRLLLLPACLHISRMQLQQHILHDEGAFGKHV